MKSMECMKGMKTLYEILKFKVEFESYNMKWNEAKRSNKSCIKQKNQEMECMK